MLSNFPQVCHNRVVFPVDFEKDPAGHCKQSASDECVAPAPHHRQACTWLCFMLYLYQMYAYWTCLCCHELFNEASLTSSPRKSELFCAALYIYLDGEQKDLSPPHTFNALIWVRTLPWSGKEPGQHLTIIPESRRCPRGRPSAQHG